MALASNWSLATRGSGYRHYCWASRTRASPTCIRNGPGAAELHDVRVPASVPADPDVVHMINDNAVVRRRPVVSFTGTNPRTEPRLPSASNSRTGGAAKQHFAAVGGSSAAGISLVRQRSDGGSSKRASRESTYPRRSSTSEQPVIRQRSSSARMDPTSNMWGHRRVGERRIGRHIGWRTGVGGTATGGAVDNKGSRYPRCLDANTSLLGSRYPAEGAVARALLCKFGSGISSAAPDHDRITCRALNSAWRRPSNHSGPGPCLCRRASGSRLPFISLRRVDVAVRVGVDAVHSVERGRA